MNLITLATNHPIYVGWWWDGMCKQPLFFIIVFTHNILFMLKSQRIEFEFKHYMTKY